MLNEHVLFQRAIDKWGKPSQCDMMVEECAELIKALSKIKRKHHPSEAIFLLENICEEVADVLIVANQMKLVFGEEAVDYWYQKKLNKLAELLDK